MQLGNHVLPDQPDAMFGAKATDYPLYKSIPDQYKRLCNQKIPSALFITGYSSELATRSCKEGVDPYWFKALLRSYLVSWEPKHEVKMAATAWLIDEFTEVFDAAVGG